MAFGLQIAEDMTLQLVEEYHKCSAEHFFKKILSQGNLIPYENFDHHALKQDIDLILTWWPYVKYSMVKFKFNGKMRCDR